MYKSDMYKIGEVNDDTVMASKSLKDMGVKETVSIEKIVDKIGKSREYFEAKNHNVINHSIRITTFTEYGEYEGIEYAIHLIRHFSIGFDQYQPVGVHKVNIEENDSTFKVVFVGVSNELEQFYSEKLRFYGSPYIATCGENKDRVIKKLHEDLKSIRKKCVPKYMKEIDAQIKELQKAKQKCNKIFGAV